MTEFVHLFENFDKRLVQQIYKEKDEAEKHRNYEYSASVKIQSWYRGARSRFYLRFMNNAAITIQKHWKGYMARIYYQKSTWDFFLKMCIEHYIAMATKIQKTWRGYQSRKKKFDYYKRKCYLENVCRKNEIVLAKLDKFAKETKEIEEIIARQLKEMMSGQKAFQYNCVQGINSFPGININTTCRKSKQTEIYHSLYDLKQGTLQISTDNGYQLIPPKTLPPLPQKPQGPFLDPAIVHLQRYKPLKPTLRVETSFDSLEKARKELKMEEWAKRLHDDNFISPKNYPTKYQPLLHTKSEYGHRPYGMKYFRETNHKLFISDKDFKTCISNSSYA
ncbi:spermatogenesis-associated protein 17-like [Octopus sinensis]|uniref:Spermatogenesis-associated protein 17-like n=1 Tax=Octopus sinensis TaxID=2607531 RepID=A0A6P7SXN6_9MOLL|nr:spermatogenesis-associated protein 17-like [Octopus sinensis]